MKLKLTNGSGYAVEFTREAKGDGVVLAWISDTTWESLHLTRAEVCGLIVVLGMMGGLDVDCRDEKSAMHREVRS